MFHANDPLLLADLTLCLTLSLPQLGQTFPHLSSVPASYRVNDFAVFCERQLGITASDAPTNCWIRSFLVELIAFLRPRSGLGFLAGTLSRATDTLTVKINFQAIFVLLVQSLSQ